MGTARFVLFSRLCRLRSGLCLRSRCRALPFAPRGRAIRRGRLFAALPRDTERVVRWGRVSLRSRRRLKSPLREGGALAPDSSSLSLRRMRGHGNMPCGDSSILRTSVSRRRRAARSGQDRPRGAKGAARQRERKSKPEREQNPRQIKTHKSNPAQTQTPRIPDTRSFHRNFETCFGASAGIEYCKQLYEIM